MVRPMVVPYARKTTIGSLNTVLYASRLKSCGRRLKPFWIMADSEENEPDTIMMKGTRQTSAMIPQNPYAMISSATASFPLLILLV